MTARELSRLFSSVFMDIHRQTSEYERMKGSDLPRAIEHLKNAITKPANIRARVNEYIDNFSSAQLGNAIDVIDENITPSELNTEFLAMENYCADLKSQIDAESITWDEASIALQGQFENITSKLVFPFPKGYTDIWGR